MKRFKVIFLLFLSIIITETIYAGGGRGFGRSGIVNNRVRMNNFMIKKGGGSVAGIGGETHIIPKISLPKDFYIEPAPRVVSEQVYLHEDRVKFNSRIEESLKIDSDVKHVSTSIELEKIVEDKPVKQQIILYYSNNDIKRLQAILRLDSVITSGNLYKVDAQLVKFPIYFTYSELKDTLSQLSLEEINMLIDIIENPGADINDVLKNIEISPIKFNYKIHNDIEVINNTKSIKKEVNEIFDREWIKFLNELELRKQPKSGPIIIEDSNSKVELKKIVIYA